MSNQWLRLWHDMPNDPKFRTVARISKQRIGDVQAVFLHLLVSASQHVTRGHADVTIEDLASALDVTDEAVQAIWDAMQGRMLDGNRLTGWEKRQPKREDSGDDASGAKSAAQRKREQREREKEAAAGAAGKGANGSGHAASRNVTLDKEKDTDKEKEHTPGAQLAAGSGEPDGSVCVLAEAICMGMKAEGIADASASHPDLLVLIGKGADIGMFLTAAKESAKKEKGFAYAMGIVRTRMVQAAELVSTAMAVPQPQPHQRPGSRGEAQAQVSDVWHESARGVTLMAVELGVPPINIATCENFPDFKKRVMAAHKARSAPAIGLHQLAAMAAKRQPHEAVA